MGKTYQHTGEHLSDKNLAIQNYMNYIYSTPEFKEKVLKAWGHYLDTGEIKVV